MAQTCRTAPRGARPQTDLPIWLDVVDWNQADNEYKAVVAKQGMIELQH